MDPLIIALLSGASFAAAFVDAVAGGGGLIMIPSLLVAGVPPQLTLGTNKFASMCGTTTALINFSLSKKVIWKIAAVGLVFSMAGSVLGTRSILYFNQATTARIILYLLPISALITFFPKNKIRTTSAEYSRLNLYLHVPLICLVLGFYDGFFGPGTGTFLILIFYMAMGMHLLNAAALAKVFNLASNSAACVTFLLAGKVMYTVGIPIAAANILGGFAGSRMAIRRGQPFIRAFLIAVFAILFVTLFARYWRA